MSAGAVSGGNVIVTIGANAKPLQATFASIRMQAKSLSTSLSTLGTSFLKLGAGISLPLGLATRTMVSFEDEMLTVKAITGATGKEFQDLTNTARKLGATTSFTATQAAEALTTMGRQGYSAAESMKAVPEVLDVARAGAVDLASAAQVVGDLGRIFAIPADELNRVGDTLVATANNSSTSFQQLSESFKFAGSSGAAAGQSIEEISLALGIVSKSLKGTLGGTSLNQALIKLTDPNNQKQLESLGVQVTKANGEFMPLVGILRNLGVATKNLPGPEKLALFKELFGIRGFRSALVIADSSAESVANLTDKISKSNGVAKETAKTMDSGIGGALRILNSAFQELQITIGEAFEGTLKDAVKSLTDAINETAIWVKENKKLVEGLAKLALTLTALGTGLLVLSALTSAFAAIISPIGLVVTALLLVLDAFGIIDTGILDIVGSFKIGGVAIKTIMADTWVYLLATWEQAKNDIMTGIDFIGSGFELLGLSIIKAMGTAALGISNLFMDLATQVDDLLGTSLKTSQETAVNFWENSLKEMTGAGDKIWDGYDKRRIARELETSKKLASIFEEAMKPAAINMEKDTEKSNKALDNIKKQSEQLKKSSANLAGGANGSPLKQTDTSVGTIGFFGGALANQQLGFIDINAEELKKQTELQNQSNELLGQIATNTSNSIARTA